VSVTSRLVFTAWHVSDLYFLLSFSLLYCASSHSDQQDDAVQLTKVSQTVDYQTWCLRCITTIQQYVKSLYKALSLDATSLMMDAP
jgi:hypothetical protein